MVSLRVNYIPSKTSRWKISFINQLPSWILLLLVLTVDNRSAIYPPIVIGFMLSIAFAFFPFYANAKLVVHDNMLELITTSGNYRIEAAAIKQISFYTGDTEDTANQVRCTVERITEPPVEFYIGRFGFKRMIKRTDELIAALLERPAFSGKLKAVSTGKTDEE